MYETDQEEFWAGGFGDAYIERNQGEKLLGSKTGIFARILSSTRDVNSVLELGCNIGLNLNAIQRLRPNVRLYGVEINKKAAKIASRLDHSKIFHQSILEFDPPLTCDLSFTAGVLIHIDPEALTRVYETLYKGSSNYILIYEYYNPIPVEIPYRGHKNKLFKRDFAGEMLDLYPTLTLLDYGFIYRRDANFPADDLNWFLLQKK